MTSQSILFVCTGNTCRSVMAEALLRHMLEKEHVTDVTIASRGLSAMGGQPASLSTINVLRALGIDAQTHRATKLLPSDVQDADLVLVMENAHREAILQALPNAASKTFLLKRYAGVGDEEPADIADPIGGTDEDYLKTRDAIQDYLLVVFSKIKQGSLT